MSEEKEQNNVGGTPYWDGLGEEQLPFFNPTEEKKKEGLRVKFLSDGPRKQTVNKYDPNKPKPELWFNIDVMGNQMTWTISQVSLLIALKGHEPLKGKTFDIQLVKVDEEFKKANPKYKGKERYKVIIVPEDEPSTTDEKPADSAPKTEEELVK